MRKILALMLTVIMIVGIFALPAVAEESVTVLDENFGKVKIQGKVQSNGSIAFGVRSAFGDSETQDVIQYFVSPRGDETSYGMENNQAFDFYSGQELVEKTSSTVFGSGTKGGGDERTAVSLSGFGWIGAGHGMTCAVTVIGEHDLTYKNIGDRYLDINNREWVLLRVSKVKEGDVMTPALVFISKELLKGDATNPTFHSFAEDKNRGYAALDGTELVNVEDSNNKVTVNKYKNSAWLRPAYNMTKQDVYVVNDGVKTLVNADNSINEGDYVLVEEEYTIMNPVYVAETIVANRPEGGYTENPNLAVGKPLVTFDLEYIYNADGTVISNWETTYHQDVTLGEFGGIQYGMKGDFVYLPGTKPFTMKSSVSLDDKKVEKDSVNFDFSNLFDTTTGYPNGYATIDTWADSSVVPNRRLDFNKSGSSFDKAYAGGQLPVFDGEPTERVNNTDRAFYFWNTRKAYHFSVGGSKADAGINKKYPDMTNATMKGSAYKKWIQDFDANGTSSFYSVPYFSDGDNSRYFYFDLYQPGVTKKYDISAYLGTYSISKLEQSANLEYSIDYETGILTVSSLENNQTSADYLVLKAKYVGESVPAVEMKMRALPTLYNESINDKLAEIAEMMETVGAPESDYNSELLANYKSLLAQKEAYEQAIKDEAANADRVAGLDNRYDFVDLHLFQDVFATYKERMSADWYEWTTGEGEITTIWPFKGITNGITPVYPMSRSKDSDGWVMAINFDGKSATAYKNAVSLETNPMVSFDEKLGRHIVNTENTKYKLGEIAEGKFGGNFATFAVTYDLQNETIADGLGIKEQVLNTSVYPNLGTSSRMDNATYTINKSGVSEINLLLTTMQVSSSGKDRSMRVPCTIEYTDGEPETIGLLVSTIGSSFQDTVFAAPKTSTTYADINTNKVAAKTVLGKDVTNENSTVSSALQKLYMPEESFILATHLRSYESGAFDGYVSSFSIPVDPTRTIKSVKLQNISSSITESFTEGSTIANATSGTGRIAFVPVTIDGASEDYNYYIHVTRACGSSGIFAMTLKNAVTWQDKIDALNAKIEALNVETTTKAQFNEIKAEINDLLAQNSSIVYVKDFSEVARTKLDNIEEYLKTHFSEEERLSMLAERTYNYIDFSQQADIDAYITAQDLGDKARFLYNASGTASSVKTPWIEGNEATYTYTPGGATEAKTINLWIPETTSKGTPVQVTDYAYTKGLLQFASYDADGDGKKESWRRCYPLHVYFMDQLIVDKTAGTNLVMSMEKFKGNKAENTNKQYTEGTFERTTSNIKFTPDNVEKVEQIGDNYYSYVKNGDVMHKIGPMNKTAYSANTLSLSNDAVTDDVVNINATGTRLDLMIAVNDVNANTGNLKNKSEKGLYDAKGVAGTYGGYKAEALTGLQKVIVNYKDGTKETKYLLLRKTQLADSMTYSYSKTGNEVEYSFIYAPKYDEAGNKIVYDGSSVGALGSKFKILNDDNAAADGLYEAGITEVPGVDAVKFENKDIVMAKSGKLARTTQHRMDTADSYYGSEAMIASVLLDSTKEVANVKFERSVDAAKNLGITLTDATNVAILPAEIEGLSDEYVYYAYCGRLGDGNYLMSATLSTAKEDIVKRASEEILNAEDAEKAEDAIVKYIDNLYLKYRDLSDEAKARYNELTDSKDTIRLAKDGTGYKTTMFVKDALEKAYTIILANYDADDNYISAQIVTGTTKDGTYYVQNFKGAPEGTAKVRAFLWKDFATLIPLAGNIGEL